MVNKLSKVIVVKIGGATLGSNDTTVKDIVQLQQQGKALVVIHGGGKIITDWLEKRGIPTRFINGERVTDEATLEVVVSVLVGLVNKEIVADINALGGMAIGISGVDGAFVQARIRDKELGYVGEVAKVDPTPLRALLKSGYIPVVAPLGVHGGKTAKALGVLNINADLVAGEIAKAIGAERLIFLTDVVGVCDQSGNLLPYLSPDEAEALVSSGVVSGGMIPKVRACLKALSGTSTTRIIDGRQPHALLNEIEGKGGGTTIKRLGKRND
jgi:acetylglutamate kinase